MRLPLGLLRPTPWLRFVLRGDFVAAAGDAGAADAAVAGGGDAAAAMSASAAAHWPTRS